MITGTVRGNVGRDAEVKVGKNNGTGFLTFSVGSNRNGNTTWVNCVMFDAKAIEYARSRVVKGARVEVYGDLNFTVDQKGNPKVDLVVHHLVSVYSKDGNSGASPPRASANSTSHRTAKAVEEFSDADEDAPFLN